MEINPLDFRTYPSMRRHARFMALQINEQGFKRICEVGVWKGRFMTSIMKVCPGITEYWGIDPYSKIKDPEDYHEANMAAMTQNEWDETYLWVASQIKHDPRFRLMRAPSSDVAEIVPDGYFDLVFIDADHRYEAVSQDIKTWLPKVRKGGWLSGHDHTKRTPGVVQAVAEAFPNENCRQHATCWRHEV